MPTLPVVIFSPLPTVANSPPAPVRVPDKRRLPVIVLVVPLDPLIVVALVAKITVEAVVIKLPPLIFRLVEKVPAPTTSSAVPGPVVPMPTLPAWFLQQHFLRLPLQDKGAWAVPAPKARPVQALTAPNRRIITS